MEIQIIDKYFKTTIYGFSATVVNNNWSQTGFQLMNKMWDKVRTHNLSHKGLNIWMYDRSNLFTGVELEAAPQESIGLKFENIEIPKYAYYKYIGPYHQIKSKGTQALDELKSIGVETRQPYIEIYGHWNNDETKLETELIWCLK
jgi:hypothetical protein